ncbi:hypothetical protein [Halorientalis pallida]|uniref:PRC-barrel domain-containing protein n=1 Tax=Halorientalis pallida TaxID=2479928 RepID=A0A498KWN5_9EURY|nr:hypothetical protein [Halorientalis pallida]RXK49336.1 hypothetical protein EAF64_10480 [Halorientalis pallida]
MSGEPSTGGEQRISSDEETIRTWATEHDVVPVRFEGSSGERFELIPESEIGADRQRVDWETFATELDAKDELVVEYGSDRDRPLAVLEREDAMAQAGLDDAEFEERLITGETVTTQVEETAVVETVVHEEATVESELVGEDVTDETVVDVRLADRECTSCDLVTDETPAAADRFDRGRYEAATRDEAGIARGEGAQIEGDDVPYGADLDVRETWTVTRRVVDEYTVESRVTGVDVSEDEAVRGQDVDVEGLHRSIVEEGLVELDGAPDDVLAQCEIESEFEEDDRIRTQFERERTVEDEVVDRLHLHAAITDGEYGDLEILETRDVSETGTMAGEGRGRIGDDEVGKRVVDATGDDVGEVTAVESDGSVVYVDPHQGITDRIMSTLGWGDDDDESYPIRTEHVERITDDRIVLKEEEQLVRS